MTLEEVKNRLTFQRQQNHQILKVQEITQTPSMYFFRIGEEAMLDYVLELLEKVEQND